MVDSTSTDYESQLPRPNALSLFSGIGGLCEGVKLAGFQVVGAVELDKYACKSYRKNFPSIPLFEGSVGDFLDPTNTTFDQQQEMVLRNGNIDLIFGGPPCQGFSQIGPRDIRDPRNEMYMHMVRMAEILRPKAVLIENVPNLLMLKGGLFKHRIVEAFRQIGYKNWAILKLSADDFGVPQSRKRVFFIFLNESTGFDLQEFAESYAVSLQGKSKVSVDDAISDLPPEVAPDSETLLSYPISSSLSDFQREMRMDACGFIYSEKLKQFHYTQAIGTEANSISLHGHHTKEIQQRRRNLLKHLGQGQKASSLPKEIWDNARPEKWRRFYPDRPAHTLMAQMHRDLSEWIHPHVDRWITVREALRLQSFHDGFVLDSSEWQQFKQVGNAVPPLLGRIPASVVKVLVEHGNSVVEKTEMASAQLTLVAA